jgi:hypothetical protein
MFFGGITGKYRKGPCLLWEKAWGTIKSTTYCEHTVPILDAYIWEHPELILMQDGAGGNIAQATMDVLEALMINTIRWPSFSPDLNPIETLWNRMKDWLQEKYPELHRHHTRLRERVIEAWEAIPNEEVIALIHSMPTRCQAVIDARGWYTKY